MTFPGVWCVSVEGKTWGLFVTVKRPGLFLLTGEGQRTMDRLFLTFAEAFGGSRDS